jgi:hypothetical protein
MQNRTVFSRMFRLATPVKRVAGLFALALTIVLVSAASQPINPPCDSLDGRFIFTLFQFDSPTTAHAETEIWSGDELVGYAHAEYFNIEQKGRGVTHMNGQHTLTFLDGSTLQTHDEIRLQADDKNPGWAQANSRLYIVEGTGDFAGATGLLHTHGLANIITLEGGIDFKGQVCVP